MKKPTVEQLAEFTERMRFLETMWGCRTNFQIDRENGRGWLEIRMPDSPAVLFIDRIDIRYIGIPGPGGDS